MKYLYDSTNFFRDAAYIFDMRFLKQIGIQLVLQINGSLYVLHRIFKFYKLQY